MSVGMSSNEIKIENLTFAYDHNRVLDRVNLDIKDKEFLGIVGPNAGGKSTLLKVLLGLLPVQNGHVSVFGKTPEKARKNIGYVPQYPAFSRDFPITVEQVVLMGRLGQAGSFFRYSSTDKEIAERVMVETEVVRLRDRQISTLSGGQLQRVLLARALACEPRVLMLDEPTANIDMRVENEIFDLLKQLNDRMTILVVSHDIAFISGYVDRVACLNSTLICHQTEDIDGQAVHELYGEDVKMVSHNHSHGHHHAH